MKKATLLTLITFSIISTSLFAQDPTDKIIGIWDADKANVEVYKSGEKFIGNPIVNGERNEKVEMLNLEFKDGQWVGKLYARKRDKYMDVVCQVEGKKLIIEVDAGFTTRKVEWTKVK